LKNQTFFEIAAILGLATLLGIVGQILRQPEDRVLVSSLIIAGKGLGLLGMVALLMK
jgi:hypothetical protein